MSANLVIYSEQSVQHYTRTRENEQRAWQTLALLDTGVDFKQALSDAAEFGIRYVLLGIPEDIGPRANLGLGGAELGWQAFLQRFLNLPVNPFFNPEKILLLGEVALDDIREAAHNLSSGNPQELEQLRSLCSEIDKRVEDVMAAIFAAGLEPIVIGGGHNNCLPILKACGAHYEQKLNAINFDPHADFRAMEGRHSGNGFRYAHVLGLLNHYHVVGLHEQKNNAEIIRAMKEAGFSYDSYQNLQVRRNVTLTHAVQQALQQMTPDMPLGIELDVDSISGMPASAYTNSGFNVADAEHFVYLCASQAGQCYLHLCEAAPARHPAGLQAGVADAGQILTGLVCSYLMAREERG